MLKIHIIRRHLALAPSAIRRICLWNGSEGFHLNHPLPSKTRTTTRFLNSKSLKNFNCSGGGVGGRSGVGSSLVQCHCSYSSNSKDQVKSEGKTTTATQTQIKEASQSQGQEEDLEEEEDEREETASGDDDDYGDNYEDEAVELTEEEIQHLSKGDPEIIKKIKYIQLEHAVMKQEGAQVPSKMRLKNWEEVILLDSRSKRKKFFMYLFKVEMTQLSRLKKKLKKQEERLQSFAENPMPSREEDPYGLYYGLNRNTLFMRLYDTTVNRFHNSKVCSAVLHHPPLVYDCSYDEFMTPREAKNCAKQMELVIAENRQHKEPFNLYLCNAHRDTKLMKYLRRMVPNLDEDNFICNVHEESFMELFPRNRLVYLTPHTRDDLEEYNEDDIYIIGTMVDRSHPKPYSLAKAKKLGVTMRRLPLDKYLMWGMGGKSLTLNQMVKIMLDVRYSRGDWKQAMRNVPMRKLNRDFHPYPNQVEGEEHEGGNPPAEPWQSQRKERKSAVLTDYELLNRQKGFKRSAMYTPPPPKYSNSDRDYRRPSPSSRVSAPRMRSILSDTD